MLRVGLTGGLGSGKSTVAKLLGRRGALVVDADQLAREVVAPGSAGYLAVVELFGPGVVAPDGTLDRAGVARLVFNDDQARLELEAITHPLIRAEVERRLSAAAARGVLVSVIEIPLLDAPRRTAYLLDAVVAVHTPEAAAVQRSSRKGWSEQDVRARRAAQPREEERLALADWVVDNGGTPDGLGPQVDRLWDWLLERARTTVAP